MDRSDCSLASDRVQLKEEMIMDAVTVDAIEEAKKEMLSKIEYNGGVYLPY